MHPIFRHQRWLLLLKNAFVSGQASAKNVFELERARLGGKAPLPLGEGLG
jgi:hypothetical protein